MSQIKFNPKFANWRTKDGAIDDFSHEDNWVLRAVNVNWNGDGWNVNANSVTNPNEWNAGNRVFSAIVAFLPSIWREFYL